jgi:hypothetical protein
MLKFPFVSFALILFARTTMAFAPCPDFSGHFQDDLLSRSFTVVQTGCAQIDVTNTSDEIYPHQAPVTMTYIMDGKRHALSQGIFMSAYWNGDTLVREPWSAETGGEMIGAQQTWELQKFGDRITIYQKLLDPADGTDFGSTVFKKDQ